VCSKADFERVVPTKAIFGVLRVRFDSAHVSAAHDSSQERVGSPLLAAGAQRADWSSRRTERKIDFWLFDCSDEKSGGACTARWFTLDLIEMARSGIIAAACVRGERRRWWPEAADTPALAAAPGEPQPLAAERLAWGRRLSARSFEPLADLHEDFRTST
jgi:hypothetical protein